MRAPNQPDAANPAMTLWLAIEGQGRRVADLGCSEEECVSIADPVGGASVCVVGLPSPRKGVGS
jgi:hypothetical protein